MVEAYRQPVGNFVADNLSLCYGFVQSLDCVGSPGLVPRGRDGNGVF
jgi:hypothetical protein